MVPARRLYAGAGTAIGVIRPVTHVDGAIKDGGILVAALPVEKIGLISTSAFDAEPTPLLPVLLVREMGGRPTSM